MIILYIRGKKIIEIRFAQNRSHYDGSDLPSKKACPFNLRNMKDHIYVSPVSNSSSICVIRSFPNVLHSCSHST